MIAEVTNENHNTRSSSAMTPDFERRHAAPDAGHAKVRRSASAPVPVCVQRVIRKFEKQNRKVSPYTPREHVVVAGAVSKPNAKPPSTPPRRVQKVANSWNDSNDFWHQSLAQKGYIVACVDGRGTGFKGTAFKKVTYKQLVYFETLDQIEVARKLGQKSYIDAERIGIWGWSYGGHMSTNCILKGNDVFALAIAVAPVTSWRFYDTIYTERFMRTPQENPEGYDLNSPFNYPELLKGDYLLIHGSGDDNVHLQNTMRMAEALVQANKPFDEVFAAQKSRSTTKRLRRELRLQPEGGETALESTRLQLRVPRPHELRHLRHQELIHSGR